MRRKGISVWPRELNYGITRTRDGMVVGGHGWGLMDLPVHLETITELLLRPIL